MTTTTFPSFVIRVLVVGRKDPIDSHSYKAREDAEADLVKITDARQGGTDVELSWLTMPGDQVQAAFIQDRTTSISVPVVAQRDPRDDPFSMGRW
jgi:hypothetical protein